MKPSSPRVLICSLALLVEASHGWFVSSMGNGSKIYGVAKMLDEASLEAKLDLNLETFPAMKSVSKFKPSKPKSNKLGNGVQRIPIPSEAPKEGGKVSGKVKGGKQSKQTQSASSSALNTYNGTTWPALVGKTHDVIRDIAAAAKSSKKKASELSTQAAAFVAFEKTNDRISIG